MICIPQLTKATQRQATAAYGAQRSHCVACGNHLTITDGVICKDCLQQQLDMAGITGEVAYCSQCSTAANVSVYHAVDQIHGPAPSVKSDNGMSIVGAGDEDDEGGDFRDSRYARAGASLLRQMTWGDWALLGIIAAAGLACLWGAWEFFQAMTSR